MIEGQKLSPKYWVVHDKMSDDVYLSCAHKSRSESERLFIDTVLAKPFGINMDDMSEEDYEELCEKYYNDKDLECILIEVKKVEGL